MWLSDPTDGGVDESFKVSQVKEYMKALKMQEILGTVIREVSKCQNAPSIHKAPKR